MGLHAREADVHACERGERGELGGHARIDSELGHYGSGSDYGSESDARARSKSFAMQ